MARDRLTNALRPSGGRRGGGSPEEKKFANKGWREQGLL